MAMYWFLMLLAPGLMTLGAITWWYRRYLRIPPASALILALIGLAAGVLVLGGSDGVFLRTFGFQRTGTLVENDFPFAVHAATLTQSSRVMPAIAFCFLVLFSLGLMAKVYLATINHLDAAERLPNAQGFRAWLRPSGVFAVAGISLTAFLSMEHYAWMISVGAAALLLAYPVANCLWRCEPKVPSAEETDAYEERRRVLALVESGRITGNEGAALIAALGQNRLPAFEPGVRFTRGRRIMLVGAGLLVIGLCLPWFGMNVGAAVEAAQKHLQSSVQGWAPGLSLPNAGWNSPEFSDWTVMIRAGDLGHGIGWMIVALGLAAAVLPLVWPTNARNDQVQRSVSLVALGTGSALLLYIVSSLVGEPTLWWRPGVFLILLGYAIIWVGAAEKYLRVPAGRKATPAIA
jgi:hypothetical protein